MQTRGKSLLLLHAMGLLLSYHSAAILRAKIKSTCNIYAEFGLFLTNQGPRPEPIGSTV
jgi:hypothetical protein